LKDKDYDNLIYGIRPVLEAIEAGKTLDKIFVQKGLQSELWHELRDALKANGISYFSVPIEKLNRLTRKNHQGVTAFISPIAFHDLGEQIQSSFESGKTPLFLMLDSVTDVRNFGAIVRTAECSGVDAIIIPHKGSASINADAVKTSAGALFNVPVCKEHSLVRAASFLQNSGFQVVGCTEKTENHIYDCDFSVPTVIVMGNEETGISPDLMTKADTNVKIPMYGTISSLNVSVATGVILYEVVRQRFEP
tara:strand:- start:8539 stop:9288 length:750 start_codon:yes stop_codon:yes gene_type:complete